MTIEVILFFIFISLLILVIVHSSKKKSKPPTPTIQKKPKQIHPIFLSMNKIQLSPKDAKKIICPICNQQVFINDSTIKEIMHFFPKPIKMKCKHICAEASLFLHELESYTYDAKSLFTACVYLPHLELKDINDFNEFLQFIEERKPDYYIGVNDDIPTYYYFFFKSEGFRFLDE